MSVTEEPPTNNASAPSGATADTDTPAANNASAASPHDQTQTASAGDSPKPADISATTDLADHAATTTTTSLPEADPLLSQPSSPSVNPFDSQVAQADDTPSLPPRPEPAEHEHAMATAAAVQESHVTTIPTPGVDAVTPQEERVSPEVEALLAMFPDFDVAVLQSVLESVNNDQERALDVLLGMSDPEYVSTQPVHQPEAPSLDLDEQLARQLMLEDQQQQRHASGTSWPRRGAGEVPYQQRQQPYGSPPGADASGERPNDQFQEFQRTMGQIAESGKRTFSSIVSRVKAKINEYEQSRNVNGGQASATSTAPQWGATPPAHLDRHTAQEAYQQQYFAESNAPVQPPASAAHNPSQVSGYDLDESVVQSQPVAVATPVPPPAAPPAQSPRASTDVPRPPPTNSGSPVNAAKIGLLPKRPVSLLNTNSPPATRPSDDDDELEYVENPFEEHK
ncbi:hypothetical protein GSI_01682 [Ganoderma sinense ZZ0214-1]|uniref:CUE domain-containing protein n=1 Tax=Ganoderma sinense ZZ0214-1 TaxID=1077348 RepID=A0A2G8SQK1_9APHY|nr:hypothetical protein GSI_01682 [Ganoderma sinense ZZ0214-1]